MGISTDRQATNERFKTELCLPFELVGDASGSIARAYRVRWPVIGMASRVTYLIGPERRVLMAHESQFDIKSHVAELRTALAGIRPSTG